MGIRKRIVSMILAGTLLTAQVDISAEAEYSTAQPNIEINHSTEEPENTWIPVSATPLFTEPVQTEPAEQSPVPEDHKDVTPNPTLFPKETQNSGMHLAVSQITMCQGTHYKISWETVCENAEVQYIADDPQLVSISTDGVIYSNCTDGNTLVHVYITEQGVLCEEQLQVTVSGMTQTGLRNVASSVQMKVGEEYQLPIELVPADSTDCIYYEVADQGIASVDSTGKVVANATGETTIRCFLANGVTLSCLVVVSTPYQKIRFPYLKENTMKLAVKQSRRLAYEVLPKDRETPELIWESGNQKIVKVSEDGKITGVKTGTATVSAITTDGSQCRKTIKVVVKKRKGGTHYTQQGMGIVNTKHQKYTYNEMTHDLKELNEKYGEFFSYEVLGQSWDHRNIYQVTLGNPDAKKVVFVQASIHAREYMTAQLVMQQIEFCCKNYYTGIYDNQYFSELFEEVCFKIDPMSNPDGVTISQYGYVGIRNSKLRNKVRSICKKYGRGRRSYYTVWKANARGVDLNRNFNCNWNLLSTSIHAPSSHGFKGKRPVSEKESQILVDTTNGLKPVACISYHAMGQIIYWNFGQTGKDMAKEKALLNTVRGVCHYSPVYSRFSKYQSTGYGDWVSICKKIPTATIEIGAVSCPLPTWQYSSVWSRNRTMLLAIARLYAK